jgi:hypothetical protein
MPPKRKPRKAPTSTPSKQTKLKVIHKKIQTRQKNKKHAKHDEGNKTELLSRSQQKSNSKSSNPIMEYEKSEPIPQALLCKLNDDIKKLFGDTIEVQTPDTKNVLGLRKLRPIEVQPIKLSTYTKYAIRVCESEPSNWDFKQTTQVTIDGNTYDAYYNEYNIPDFPTGGNVDNWTPINTDNTSIYAYGVSNIVDV